MDTLTDALTPLLTAFLSRLRGDATLLALVPSARITNDAPDVKVYPYVQIGNATQRPWHTFGGKSKGVGWNTTLTVHVYSTYEGDIEALRIAARVVALMTFEDFAVGTLTTAMCELDQVRVLVEQVERIEIRHAPVVFRVYLS